MIAEVIALGDELTSGERVDTNSAWISQRLGELGVSVRFHTTAGDDLAACEEVFRRAIERAAIVIATGGLGPTADDLTRYAIAAATKREIVVDAASLARIEALFRARGRTMPERNRVQAEFPAGSRPIPNPQGTAPGIDLTVPRGEHAACRLFALPGVPAEMFEMWSATVGPAIAEMTGGGRRIRHFRLKCFGTGESHLEAMLPDLIRRGREPSVGITVHEGTITLRITATAPSEEACQAAIEPVAATIRECLGPLVFGTGDDELENAVGRLLAERGETVATAEWGTGGLVSHWLSTAPECRESYRGGLVLADARAAEALLGETAARLSSQELAESLARRTRDSFGASIGVATSRVPTDEGLTAEESRFYIAVARGDDVVARSLTSAAHAAILRPLAAKRVLDLLRRTLLGEEEGK